MFIVGPVYIVDMSVTLCNISLLPLRPLYINMHFRVIYLTMK